MSHTLCFFWDSSNKKEISYVVFDQAFGQTIAFTKIHVTTNQAADTVIQNIAQRTAGFQLTVEYNILHNSPVAQTFGPTYAPNPLSAHILAEFTRHFPNTQAQTKSFLKKPSLTEFSKGLKNLGLATRGEAWKEKLYMMAVHATGSNYKKGMKEIWRAKRRVFQAGVSELKQFRAWFASL